MKEIQEIKDKMKSYKDLYGFDLCDKHLIDGAKNIIDLEAIINRHYDYIEDMANDAQVSLMRFKRENKIY